MLEMMHPLLAACLPDGVFVEATLCRFGPDGKVTAAPAGGSRFLVRHKAHEKVDLLTLRGFWLGTNPPDPNAQQSWNIGTDDEVVFGSDGLFEQISFSTKSPDDFAPLIAASNGCSTLLDVVYDALQKALQNQAQIDDITAVAVRRLGELVEVSRGIGETCLSPS
jgi:serine phosphatase RsbU (regulator of sigma subunit)